MWPEGVPAWAEESQYALQAVVSHVYIQTNYLSSFL